MKDLLEWIISLIGIWVIIVFVTWNANPSGDFPRRDKKIPEEDKKVIYSIDIHDGDSVVIYKKHHKHD